MFDNRYRDENKNNPLFTRLLQIKQENNFTTLIWDDARLERAVRGANEYQQTSRLVNPDLQKKALDNPSIQMCFLGIAPVQHFVAELSLQEVDQINTAFSLRGKKYIAIQYSIPLSNDKNTVLVNLEAAKAVITENKDIFDGIGDSDNYLKTNIRDYLVSAKLFFTKINEQRHGVLSGFPRDSVDLYSKINNGLGKDRFFNRPNQIEVGNRPQDGFFYIGFSEKDKQWANEAIALKNAIGIGK